jgi:spore germination cell wall hydrolase CwlJ-like protein
MFMEARSEPLLAQQYVASVVIERARKEEVTLCASIKKPKSYSWMWDGVNTKVPAEELKRFEMLAAEQLRKPSLSDRLYFNECSLGKRYATQFKVLRSGKLCFY